MLIQFIIDNIKIISALTILILISKHLFIRFFRILSLYLEGKQLIERFRGLTLIICFLLLVAVQMKYQLISIEDRTIIGIFTIYGVFYHSFNSRWVSLFKTGMIKYGEKYNETIYPTTFTSFYFEI